MNTHFKLQVIKHLPYKIAEKIFNSYVQMNGQNHVGMHTVCVCVCVCVAYYNVFHCTNLVIKFQWYLFV